MSAETDWLLAISFVLKMEGGSTAENDPNDPGGLTKFGISKKAYPTLDIANLTLEAARAIYKEDYWFKCGCPALPSPVNICVFDTAVNQGPTMAIKILQRALSVKDDGELGRVTLAAATAASPLGLLKKYLARRLESYARLMAAKPELLVFAFNWSYRVISLSDLVL